jgi:hypothetical protein
LLFCMFFSLPIRFFYFQTIYLYIYTTTAVQTEKQKNVLNLEPLSVVLWGHLHLDSVVNVQ